jgi:hypothetical protein
MRRRLLMKCIVLVIWLAGLAPILRADMFAVGTWVRRPNKDGGSSTMVIETVGSGRKLTFKVATAGGGTATMIVATQLDGKDATVYVDGKPSGETMAIRLVDDHHAINVIKMNGNPMVTQKSELSPDGKVIKVESTPGVSGAEYGTEYWDKK